MADDTRRPYWPQTVSHPGETVIDYLEAYDWSQRDLARRAGMTPKTVSEICGGKTSISPATALALEHVFQRPAHFWLNLQRLHDECRAREAAQSGRESWADWVKNFPIKEMTTLGMLPDGPNLVDSVLSFFGVSSPESWNAVFREANVSYRQTTRFEIKEFSVATWVRATELQAAQIDVEPFDADRLLRAIPQLREVTRAPVESFVPEVQRICASAGVAVVWVPALKKTGISGCARWLSDKKALIALSLRYKTDDQMWFTFFHEVGHVLLHRKRNGFILDNVSVTEDELVDPEVFQQEVEANRFAADTLIPPRDFDAFLIDRAFTSESIYRFSEHIGVSPGIVVGRLQKERYLRADQGNALKRKLGFRSEEVETGD